MNENNYARNVFREEMRIITAEHPYLHPDELGEIGVAFWSSYRGKRDSPMIVGSGVFYNSERQKIEGAIRAMERVFKLIRLRRINDVLNVIMLDERVSGV